jgi:hypothetical protein
VKNVLGMRSDASPNAEDRLDEKRRLHELAIQEVGGGVEVAGVVALQLESRAVPAALLQDVRNVLERVLEHSGFAARKI